MYKMQEVDRYYLFRRVSSHEQEKPTKGGQCSVGPGAEQIGKQVIKLWLREISEFRGIFLPHLLVECGQKTIDLVSIL